MTAIADPANLNSTHHVVLDLGTTNVGIMLCDGKGKLNPRAFKRDPMPSGSLKISSGLQRYSDMEPPWTDIAQSDWSGGKGQKDFERDQTMYYDGYQVNTCRPGEIILGGKATSTLKQATSWGNTEGDTDGIIYKDEEVDWYHYYAYKFTTVGAISVVQANLTICLDLCDLADTLRLGISEITDGAPGAVTYSTNWARGTDFSNGILEDFAFDITKSLDATTDYCLVFRLVLHAPPE